MINRFILLTCAASILGGCSFSTQGQDQPVSKDGNMEKIVKTEQEWKEQLTPFQYHIVREKGTETAFTGQYWDFFEKGSYDCIACGARLFTSVAKFDSSCGWPSFFEPESNDAIEFHRDTSYGMVRTEVVCARCGAHLGHVFEDGPPPTGLRYCINSAALKFIPAEK